MTAESNISGMARLLYIVGGVAVASWGLWGADPGWTEWVWVVLGGCILVLGLIGFSPIHEYFLKKE